MKQRINRHSEGVFIIAATPFSENGELDLLSTDLLVDFYLNSGVSGMICLKIWSKQLHLMRLMRAKLRYLDYR